MFFVGKARILCDYAGKRRERNGKEIFFMQGNRRFP